MDVIYPILGPPIIHERIGKRLGEFAADAVQFVPVTIRGISGQAGNYVVLNVLRRIACLDRNASEYLTFDGKLSWIAKGVLQRSLAKGAHVFRLDEYDNWIVVSRQVKEMLEAEHVTGVTLVPLETTD